jgi:hypothetical protein
MPKYISSLGIRHDHLMQRNTSALPGSFNALFGHQGDKMPDSGDKPAYFDLGGGILI